MLNFGKTVCSEKMVRRRAATAFTVQESRKPHPSLPPTWFITRFLMCEHRKAIAATMSWRATSICISGRIQSWRKRLYGKRASQNERGSRLENGQPHPADVCDFDCLFC